MHAIEKECLRCKEVKLIEAFQLDKRGRRNVCRKCRTSSEVLLKKLRAQWREKNPGKEPTECECCGRKSGRLVLDHCHQTLEMRGWLCDPCNVAIGNLGDNLAGVMQAVRYLQERQS